MKKILSTLILFLSLSNICFATDKVNVYYFYGKPRCATCVKIENYTKGAVESMNDKTIVYQSIDMEKNKNEPIFKKYNLYTKAVIISKVKNGKEKWKNLDKIWLKTGNEQDFKKYIITEITTIKEAK